MTTSIWQRWHARRRSRFLSLTASAALVAVALTAPPAVAADSVPLVPTDLGTLGGDTAIAQAVSGDIAVGRSTNASGYEHAFTYTLSTQEWTDLGTLGGPGSDATDVDGDIVVGSAYTADWVRHAFAYDLGAADPTMIDLGTLGGSQSYAEGVDGDIIVGQSTDAAGVPRAFVYDLGAAEPQMTDLGTGPWSWASAVDGDLVVGYYDNEALGVRAFAYDLGSGEMTDLGSLGGYDTRATGISGDIVVGSSQAGSPGPTRAFVYDLGAAAPQMVDIGTLGGSNSWAEDVDGDIVVGYSNNASGMVAGFAYSQSTGAMTELGALVEDHASHGMGVDGSTVVGDDTNPWSWGSRALAWQLPPTDSTPPELSLSVEPDPVLQGLAATATFSATDPESAITDTTCEASFAVDTSVSGEHSISCSATSAGGTSTAGYTYTVLTPAEGIADLREYVTDEVTANTRPLTSMLDNASKSLAKGDSDSAIDQLTAFMALVDAQTGKKIPEDLASALIAQAQMVIDSIEATS